MKELVNSFEENGKTYERDYTSESKEKSIHIPLYMRSESQTGIMRKKNRKSPSGRKHFF